MSDPVNEFFKQFYPPQEKIDAAQPEIVGTYCTFRRVEGYSSVFPAMVCNDGFQMSVQGHAGAYCRPRDDWAGSYTMVEVGFPSDEEELLMPYAEEPNRPTETVYGYVPIDVVEAVIEKHGGLKAREAS